jgi:DnaJ-class molecular chaperone
VKAKRPKCKTCKGYKTVERHDAVTGEYLYDPCPDCGGKGTMTAAEYRKQYPTLAEKRLCKALDALEVTNG